MPISNNRFDECAPERGNEPPAQGSALGNKGNRTDGIHRQGQMPAAFLPLQHKMKRLRHFFINPHDTIGLIE